MFNLCKQLEPEQAEKLKNFACEIKFDGERSAFITEEGKLIRMENRRGANNLNKYPQFKEDFKGHTAILDSEVVVFKGLKTHLTWLQEKLNWKYAKAICFDILSLDGRNLRGLAWRERRGILEKLMAELQLKNFLISPLCPDFKKAWGYVKKEQLEGLVLKNKDGKYTDGRTWFKVKNRTELIIRFTQAEKNPAGIRLSDGFHAVQVHGGQANEVLEILQRDGSVSCEVEGLEILESGHIRQPIFKRLASEQQNILTSKVEI